MRIYSSFITMDSSSKQQKMESSSFGSSRFINFLETSLSENSERKVITRSEQNTDKDEWRLLGRLSLTDTGKKIAIKVVKSSEEQKKEDLNKFEKLKMNMLEELIERLVDKKTVTNTKNDAKKSDNKMQGIFIDNRSRMRPRFDMVSVKSNDISVSIDSQQMNFSSEGKIKTQDGRQINFSIDIGLSQEFIKQHSISPEEIERNFEDPLVINFDGTMPELSDRKFGFDINTDGKEEQINTLETGSGFLALDLNNDNIINSGKELFGPRTGEGFSDLGLYDLDKNNWIDENDPVFNNLRIWVKDQNVNDVLYKLSDKKIGAIYIGNVKTSFNLNDDDDKIKGSISSVGIYVKEDGNIGTIMDMNLAT
jgi:hypothetical protein